jgi:hypothetical protein
MPLAVSRLYQYKGKDIISLLEDLDQNLNGKNKIILSLLTKKCVPKEGVYCKGLFFSCMPRSWSAPVLFSSSSSSVDSSSS